MTDIVERVLDWADETYVLQQSEIPAAQADMREAAAEIERLRAALAQQSGEPVALRPDKMVIGGLYNWKGQPERLIYVGKKGCWSQFKKIGDPRPVWCEVYDSDLELFEETATQQSDEPDPMPGMSEINREIAYCAAQKLRDLGYEWSGTGWNELIPATAPQQHKPLTDEQICAALGIDGADDWTYTVARAVEAALGIKEAE